MPAHADESSSLIAGLKVLPLLINKISGDTTAVIVYDPGLPASKAEADAIKNAVDNGAQLPGGGKLTGLLISVNELGKLSRGKIAFVTNGLGAHFDDINTAASAASVLTISTDIDCVKTGKCIIGVATAPSTTIYYSKAAADAAKIEFSQDFVMVVKQL